MLDLNGGKLFPELLWQIFLSFLAPDVVHRVREVPFHLRPGVRGVEALDVLVDERHQPRDVPPRDLFVGVPHVQGGRKQDGDGLRLESHTARGNRSVCWSSTRSRRQDGDGLSLDSRTARGKRQPEDLTRVSVVALAGTVSTALAPHPSIE